MAERISLDLVISERRVVLFDTNVLIGVIRDPASLLASTFNRVPPSQRAISEVVLFEFTFAKRTGFAASTMEEDQKWLRDHGVTFLPFVDKGPAQFRHMLHHQASLLRARCDLGDALLSAHALSSNAIALATKNVRDFEQFNLALIDEFAA